MVCNILFPTHATDPRIPDLRTKHECHLSRIKTLVILVKKTVNSSSNSSNFVKKNFSQLFSPDFGTCSHTNVVKSSHKIAHG